MVARQRAEIVDLQRVAALMPVLERAKGAVMVQEGCSAQEAYETLLERSAAEGRTLVEECWLTLGAIRPARSRDDDDQDDGDLDGDDDRGDARGQLHADDEDG
ncbi:ANTAR domain-containing protein, partial [Streptomyces sp. NPDC001139]